MMKSQNKTGIPLITMISIRDQEARVSEKNQLSIRLAEFSWFNSIFEILFLKFQSEMTHTEETHKYDLFEQNEQFLLFTFISVTV